MIRTIVESPYFAFSVEDRIVRLVYLRNCLADSIARGEAPFASHFIYPHFLDDNDADDRLQGLMLGQVWASVAERVAVYVDLGISPGMRRGIKLAQRREIPRDYRSVRGLSVEAIKNLARYAET